MHVQGIRVRFARHRGVITRSVGRTPIRERPEARLCARSSEENAEFWCALCGAREFPRLRETEMWRDCRPRDEGRTAGNLLPCGWDSPTPATRLRAEVPGHLWREERRHRSARLWEA